MRFNLRCVTKSGEIMFTMQNSRRIDESEDEIPNFRVWTKSGYGAPLAKASADSDRRFMIFAGVSIVSPLFSKVDSASYMMHATNVAYGDQEIPVCYFVGDELQKITEVLLHKSDPQVVKTLNEKYKKWHSTYESALVKEVEANTQPNHALIHWSQLHRHPDFNRILKFLRVIISFEEITLTFLNETFPEADSAMLSKLQQDLDETRAVIKQRIQAGADHFAKTNTVLLEKQRVVAKEARDYDSKRANKMKFVFDSSKPTSEDSEEEIEKEQAEDIKKATCEYFAEEFTGFLLLFSRVNARQIISELSVKSESGSLIAVADQAVTPVLSYPISVSGENAENTFQLFDQAKELYHKYAQGLNLPTIDEQSMIVDSYVPESLRSSKKKQTVANKSSSSGSDNSGDERKQLPALINTQSEGHVVSHTGELILSDRPYTNGFPMTAFAPQTEEEKLKEQHRKSIEKITEKIFALVEAQTRFSGEKNKTLDYINGVTCKIKISKILKDAQEEQEVYAEISEQKKAEQFDAMRKLIRDVVSSALDGCKDATDFEYDGYKYELEGYPTPGAEMNNGADKERLSVPFKQGK